MNLFEQFLLFVTYCNLGGNKWNIVGVIWLVVLTVIFFRRFRDHFNNGFAPCPKENPLNKIWLAAIGLVSFYSVFWIQMMVDDFITTPINIMFGSWYLIAPHLGSFEPIKWLMFKWDVYAMILVILLLFHATTMLKFFEFTPTSLTFLIATYAFQVFLASQGVFYFLDLTGTERIVAYWVSYPWFRILTGAFAISILKKPEVS